VESETGPHRLEAETAWHGAGAVVARAAIEDTRLLAFELVRQPPPAAGGGRVQLEHPVALSGDSRWLIRCDRVDFAPGGVAQPHRHRGGGIRRLLRGALTVTVGEAPARLLRPGDPWFESGREPVLAVAADAETSFVRVSILPAAIRGQSSIVYVDAADATRSRPRTYTVYVDEPLVELG
jgi:quercetin dioxygenase-like cupin family protein